MDSWDDPRMPTLEGPAPPRCDPGGNPRILPPGGGDQAGRPVADGTAGVLHPAATWKAPRPEAWAYYGR